MLFGYLLVLVGCIICLLSTMPSPIGHSIAGFCGYLLVYRTAGMTLDARLSVLGVSLFLANLPDIDILPGLLLGNPSMFHRQATHSLIVALILSGLAMILAIAWKRLKICWIVWGSLLYFSHIFLDLLVFDPSEPKGVQLFWPISDHYFISPITVFSPFDYFSPDTGIWRSVLSMHNVFTVSQEIVLMLPLAWGLYVWGVTSKSIRSTHR